MHIRVTDSANRWRHGRALSAGERVPPSRVIRPCRLPFACPHLGCFIPQLGPGSPSLPGPFSGLLKRKRPAKVGALSPPTPPEARGWRRAHPLQAGIKRTRPHHRRAKGEGGECPPPHTGHSMVGSGVFYSITPSANAPIRPALERRGDVRKCHPSRARMSPLRLPFGRRAARVRFSGEPSPAACRGTDPKRAAATLAGWRSSGGQPASFYLVFP